MYFADQNDHKYERKIFNKKKIAPTTIMANMNSVIMSNRIFLLYNFFLSFVSYLFFNIKSKIFIVYAYSNN